MRVAAIIESRMSSRRLPGKNLKPIAGRPMLGKLIDRLKCARTLDVICLATSDDPSDAVLQDFARSEGIECFRGSLEDVLDRVLCASRSVEADIVVGVTGDCPLVDPAMIDATVRRHSRGDADYIFNALDRLTFPIGFDVQVYAARVLDEVSRLATDSYDRVNVTPYIYHHPERYRLLNLHAPPELDRPRYRLCVDHPEDFTVISAIFERFEPQGAGFSAFDIIQFLDDHPELATSNVGRDDAFPFPTSGGEARQEMMQLT